MGSTLLRKCLRRKVWLGFPHVGLGFTPPPPVRISIKRTSNHYITVEDEASSTSASPTVFDRMKKRTGPISVFDRLGPSKKKGTVRRSVHERLGVSKSSKKSKKTERSSVVVADPKEYHSLISSRMRRHTFLVVSCGEVLIKGKLFCIQRIKWMRKMKRVLHHRTISPLTMGDPKKKPRQNLRMMSS